jgi:hypothetical protein
MEIVLPGSMTVIDSHDIALALQHKIEAMIDVERAFVHVDHQERDGLEHKVFTHSLLTLIQSILIHFSPNEHSSNRFSSNIFSSNKFSPIQFSSNLLTCF